MKILNLYAGIGGNRKLWGDAHEVTAVEIDPYIARAYAELWPKDTVVVGDAHSYLLAHFHEFDFVWSSPPCPSHGQYRYNVGVRAKGYKPLYPDMQLYEEIIMLAYHCKAYWVVENVKPYYQPLIDPMTILGRHLIWSNFLIPERKFPPKDIRSKNKISDYSEYDLSNTRIPNKRQVLRNCVDSEMGLHILNNVPYGKEGKQDGGVAQLRDIQSLGI